MLLREAAVPIKFLKVTMGAGKMHPDETPVDLSLVRGLLAAQFPQWAGLPVEPVDSSGTDNAMYRLGEDMAVRLPRIDWAAGNVEREQRWLPLLARSLPVPIPVPLGKGKPAEGYPWDWSVVRWLKGDNPIVNSIANADRLGEDLAEFILALRQIDPIDGPPAGRGVPLSTRDAPTRAAIEQLHGIVDTAAVTSAWEVALRLPEWTGPVTWLHGDLSPGNILIADDRLSGVIDFGGVGVGDPSVDLIVAWNMLPAAARRTFRAALHVDDATWKRGRGWALSIALIQLPYYKDTNPALSANARHVIREVLSDHELSV
jgi:aminoglycoside phosphotransferase (APT) family kinase protein